MRYPAVNTATCEESESRSPSSEDLARVGAQVLQENCTAWGERAVNPSPGILSGWSELNRQKAIIWEERGWERKQWGPGREGNVCWVSLFSLLWQQKQEKVNESTARLILCFDKRIAGLNDRMTNSEADQMSSESHTQGKCMQSQRVDDCFSTSDRVSDLRPDLLKPAATETPDPFANSMTPEHILSLPLFSSRHPEKSSTHVSQHFSHHRIYFSPPPTLWWWPDAKVCCSCIVQCFYLDSHRRRPCLPSLSLFHWLPFFQGNFWQQEPVNDRLPSRRWSPFSFSFLSHSHEHTYTLYTIILSLGERTISRLNGRMKCLSSPCVCQDSQFTQTQHRKRQSGGCLCAKRRMGIDDVWWWLGVRLYFFVVRLLDSRALFAHVFGIRLSFFVVCLFFLLRERKKEREGSAPNFPFAMCTGLRSECVCFFVVLNSHGVVDSNSCFMFCTESIDADCW